MYVGLMEIVDLDTRGKRYNSEQHSRISI